MTARPQAAMYACDKQSIVTRSLKTRLTIPLLGDTVSDEWNDTKFSILTIEIGAKGQRNNLRCCVDMVISYHIQAAQIRQNIGLLRHNFHDSRVM